MGKEPASLRDVIASGMTIWAFCLYCAHASLFDPAHLGMRLRNGNEELGAMAKRFRCTQCRRKGVKLIPTPRTLTSFDKMGG